MTSQESSVDPEQGVLVNSVCANCGGPAQYLCEACGQAGPRYCSATCQSDHWEKGHASVCASVPSGTESEENDSERNSRAVKRSSSKVYSRGNVAQLINLKQRRSTLTSNTTTTLINTPNSNDPSPAIDPVQADEFRFYMQQVYRIIKPVVLCIVLSVLWVKLSQAPSYFIGSSSPAASGATGNSSDSSPISTSIYAAAILIGQIIVATVVIVFLFKYGFTKILVGFFMFVVLFPLGFMSYILISNIITTLSIPLDYITLIFALWNFSAVGLVSVFWKGPLLLQQAYLTVMSSLMAFSLTGLSSWTTWILLGLLAIWDLIAVLCPFGPLRILVESSKENQREIPALLYSVNAVWLMAAPKLSNQIQPTTSSTSLQALTDSSPSSFISSVNSVSTKTSAATTPSGEDIPLSENLRHNIYNRNLEVGVHNNTEVNNSSNSLHTNGNISENNELSDDEEEDERNGLKLGLGDFVFYSVLVAQAATFDWITTIACIVAVLTGLNATIFLLAIYRKALPALPISIVFGMLFYFVSRWMLVPYAQTLGGFLVAV
ncbi:Presenilin-domain-containing protein [Gigaspora rosea]|uniref:Presenilin n=1 Tax=Gigaspora rosea TaxID=44941 RepID=A0A397V5D0_9GLOM|nr:Presenilin-domain-containing protein [Gigaspora rosea]